MPVPLTVVHRPFRLGLALCCLALALPQAVAADQAAIRVAVAANFAETLRDLAATYEQQHGVHLQISVGSTGSLCSQIEQGAPFDLFLAADARRPTMLEERGAIVAGTRRTYAQGGLVLWSAKPELFKTLDVLSTGAFARLAIANPETAPYGLAARQVLEHLGLWDGLQDRLVRGQSIGQTHQFVSIGAADLGFVALAQVTRPGQELPGSVVAIDPALHEPILQQVVMLSDRPAVRAFWAWITEDPLATERIRAYGYLTPFCQITSP